MTSFDFGEVVLVHFPQSGTTARKQRPEIVVLDIGDADLVIAPVTSRLDRKPATSRSSTCQDPDLSELLG